MSSYLQRRNLIILSLAACVLSGVAASGVALPVMEDRISAVMYPAREDVQHTAVAFVQDDPTDAWSDGRHWPRQHRNWISATCDAFIIWCRRWAGALVNPHWDTCIWSS